MKDKWVMRKGAGDNVVLDSSINPVISKILFNRGIDTKEKINKFMKGTIDDLYDGRLMKDMEKGISIIKEFIENKKPILIYGDYDCDGVSSTCILLKGLKVCGANVSYHIPHREHEGYGMNEKRIGELHKEGYELILTCDNGISAFNEIQYAKSLGMKVVITDHHDIPFEELPNGEVKEKIPYGDAIINPKQKDCNYPFKVLCGAGIAYKFILSLCDELSISRDKVQDLIEIAAIATICDVVDLVDENRIIVKEGLKRLNSTNNIGLSALIKANKLDDKVISEYHLGFVIGPCINATGRLETADIALELLLCEDKEKATILASKLLALNTERQDMTMSSIEKVLGKIEDNGYQKDKVMFIYEPTIHESLAGIVAGRIRERYNVPAIIMTSGKEMPKGSGRSIEKYDMYKELNKCKDLIHKFGGHPMAAGLSCEEELLSILRKELLKNCELTDSDIIPEIRVDMRLPFGSLNYSFIEEIENLTPFGKGNPKPLFGEKDVTINRVWFMGQEKNHIRVSFLFQGKTINGVAFNKAEDFREMLREKFGEQYAINVENSGICNLKCALVYYPDINEYNGKKSIQVKIESFLFQ